MAELTTRERFERIFGHKEADRVPMLGAPWGTTLERWRREGMPQEADFAEHFGLDRVIGVDVVPPRGDIGDVSFVREFIDTRDYSKGYVYNFAEGASWVIPTRAHIVCERGKTRPR